MSLPETYRIRDFDVHIVAVSDRARIPTRGTPGASGFDLYTLEDEIIGAQQMRTLPTGIAMQIPWGVEGQIRPRSSTLRNHGLVVILGTIDSDYRGELKVCVFNASTRDTNLVAGDRIAQLVIAPVAVGELIVLPNGATLDGTERGAGGLGSTGR